MITQEIKKYYEERTTAAKEAQKQLFVSEAELWRSQHGPFRKKKVVTVDELESKMNQFWTK